MLNAIVVHDPRREVPDGQIIRGELEVAKAKSHGLLLLPVDLDHAADGLGGYFRRGWGTGWLMNRNSGERACPMALGADPEFGWIYWAAWVVSSGGDPRGSVRLASDTTVPGVMQAGIGASDAADLGGNPEGFAIAGKCQLTAKQRGPIAVSLWGVAKHSLIVVSAVSTTRREVGYP